MLKFLLDTTHGKIYPALLVKNWKAVQMAARTLKDMSGNLGLSLVRCLFGDRISATGRKTRRRGGFYDKLQHTYDRLVNREGVK